MQMKSISGFTGEYRWLSNFWPCKVEFEGKEYSSSEHAYQASKTVIESEREMIRSLSTPGKAKRAGRKITIREDWDSVRLDVMKKILVYKFMRNKDLFNKLVQTGTVELIESNSWGDVFWGVCDGKGENHLGRILMDIRTRCQRIDSAVDDMIDMING